MARKTPRGTTSFTIHSCDCLRLTGPGAGYRVIVGESGVQFSPDSLPRMQATLPGRKPSLRNSPRSTHPLRYPPTKQLDPADGVASGVPEDSVSPSENHLPRARESRPQTLASKLHGG